MATTGNNPPTLSNEERRAIQTLLAEFERDWSDGQLKQAIQQIPFASGTARRVALVELIKRDLAQQWQRGRKPRLEGYLHAYPELGTGQTASFDLIHAEYKVRLAHGDVVDLAELAQRFPHQKERLARLSAPARENVTDAELSPAPRDTPAASSVQTPPPQAAVPRRELSGKFGRYEVVKKIGQGGMGAVYLAQDTQLGRPVALKVPHFNPAEGDQAPVRFLREARAAATLRHPHICQVYDFGQQDGIHFLSMEYIEGKQLSTFISGNRKLPPRHVVAVVRKLALTLQEAHSRGVVHRDLKPANVMINQRKEPVIMDFGLAQLTTSEGPRLTQAGAIMGTPHYMAPEQIHGDLERMGPCCDIYSLGVILYEMLTARLPFEGSSLAVLGLVLTQPPTPPSVHRPDLEPELEAVCLKALAKSPDHRYASMQDFAAALSKYLRATGGAVAGTLPDQQADQPAGEPLPSSIFKDMTIVTHSAAIGRQQQPVEPVETKGRGTLAAIGAAVAVLLALAVGGVGWYSRNQEKERPSVAETEPPKPPTGSSTGFSPKVDPPKVDPPKVDPPKNDPPKNEQVKTEPLPPLSNRYGGIEIGGKGVKAVVIEELKSGTELQLRTVFSKSDNTTIVSGLANNRYTATAIQKTVDSVDTFAKLMREQHQVGSDKIRVVASSGVAGISNESDSRDATNRAELRQAILQRTGLELDFLNVKKELFLTIQGIIEDAYISEAILVDIGSGNTKLGFYKVGSDTTLDTLSMVQAHPSDFPNALLGVVRFTDRVLEQQGKTSSFLGAAEQLKDGIYVKPVRQELGREPGLTARKRVYLNGGIVWAMVTLLYPEKIQEAYVTLTARDIDLFYKTVSATNTGIPEPNLGLISSEPVRRLAQAEIARVRDTFSVNNLQAGAVILRSLSEELEIEKRSRSIHFARFGHFGWILSYVKREAQAAPK